MLESSQSKTIPDIERNGFCFSDGCGFINPALALKLARMHGMTYCSAFQIRFAGAKGVCVIKQKLFKKSRLSSDISDSDLE